MDEQARGVTLRANPAHAARHADPRELAIAQQLVSNAKVRVVAMCIALAAVVMAFIGGLPFSFPAALAVGSLTAVLAVELRRHRQAAARCRRVAAGPRLLSELDLRTIRQQEEAIYGHPLHCFQHGSQVIVGLVRTSPRGRLFCPKCHPGGPPRKIGLPVKVRLRAQQMMRERNGELQPLQPSDELADLAAGVVAAGLKLDKEGLPEQDRRYLRVAAKIVDAHNRQRWMVIPVGPDSEHSWPPSAVAQARRLCSQALRPMDKHYPTCTAGLIRDLMGQINDTLTPQNCAFTEADHRLWKALADAFETASERAQTWHRVYGARQKTLARLAEKPPLPNPGPAEVILLEPKTASRAVTARRTLLARMADRQALNRFGDGVWNAIDHTTPEPDAVAVVQENGIMVVSFPQHNIRPEADF